MATIIINANDIEDHINENGSLHLDSFSIDRPQYSFNWFRNGPDDPEVEYTFDVTSDFEYDIDVTEFEEYTDLQQDLEILKNGYHEVLANNDELIKENASLKAELAKVNRSVFGRLFSK
jgi:hypothetical protein